MSFFFVFLRGFPSLDPDSVGTVPWSLCCGFVADPDPAFYFDADPDPTPTPKLKSRTVLYLNFVSVSGSAF
jgi:hypothetical protein